GEHDAVVVELVLVDAGDARGAGPRREEARVRKVRAPRQQPRREGAVHLEGDVEDGPPPVDLERVEHAAAAVDVAQEHGLGPAPHERAELVRGQGHVDLLAAHAGVHQQ
ncbi:hypothetical protein DC025_14560, partial [Enterococcus faecalis]